MEELTELLKTATAQVPQGYFHLNIDGGDPIYRERVYCYEFYHQLRSIWPQESEFYLNGEIDKSAHPILRQLGADRVKPDFLVHKPGYMSGNHAIIEVKKEDVDRAGIKKDLETLALFLSNVGYERAIYLIYGYSIDETSVNKNLTETYQELKINVPIEIWFHRADGAPAECVQTLSV